MCHITYAIDLVADQEEADTKVILHIKHDLDNLEIIL